MKKAWSAVTTRGTLAVSIIAGLLLVAVGGLSVALAAEEGGGNDARADRDRFVPGAVFHAQVPAPDPELEAKMEEFHDCMTDEGFEPPEPAERPDISEGPPAGLDDAFEKCGEFLPEGMPPGPPGMGPPGPGGPLECKAIPEGRNGQR